MFGIKTLCDGTVGWMVGNNNDILLFPDKATAAAALKKMKSGDAYSWNCQVEVAAFSGWGKK
jgi:hypothetical protein